MRNPVINPRLSRLRTRIPRRHDSDQEPSALLLHHQRPPRVSLAAVSAPVFVSGTQHLVVDDHADALRPMPTFAHPVVDYRHLNGLQRLGSKAGAGAECPPACCDTHLPQEALAARGQAYGGDMGKLVGCPVQAEDGHVEAVSLWGEFEVGVDLWMKLLLKTLN